MAAVASVVLEEVVVVVAGRESPVAVVDMAGRFLFFFLPVVVVVVVVVVSVVSFTVFNLLSLLDSLPPAPLYISSCTSSTLFSARCRVSLRRLSCVSKPL